MMRKMILAMTTAATLLFAGGGALACTAQDAQAVNAIVAQTNAYRATKGLRPLTLDPAVSRAALGHACDMTQKGFFNHTGSNGSSAMSRMKGAGVKACVFAENIAMGPSKMDVVNLWIRSAGHRKNIENPSVDRIGVALVKGADGQVRWVQNFAQGCSQRTVIKRQVAQPQKARKESGWSGFTW